MLRRRTLLLIAIVLGLAAVAAALSPPPESADDATGENPPRLREPATGPARVDPVLEITLRVRADGEARRPRVRRVPSGARVALVVWTDAPGEVTIPRLGQLRFAEERAPARFDLLLDDPGSYEVVFSPAAGPRGRTIGRLEVRAEG